MGGNSVWVNALRLQNFSLQAAGHKIFLVTLGSVAVAVLHFPWAGLGLKEGGCPGLARGAQIRYGERSTCMCAVSVEVL